MIASDRIRPVGRAVSRSGRRLGWIEISFAALCVLLGFASVGFPSSAEATMVSPLNKGAVYLPMMASNAGVVVTPVQTCELNAEESAILQMMQEHPDQGRAQVNCNPILAEVARARAEDMAKRRYFDHVDPDGCGPNQLVTEAGFKLPDYYPDSGTANNLESIGAGFNTPASVWEAWMNSHYHRIHVLGTDAFYAGQEEVGVGYYFDGNSQYGAYWVVITAPTEKR